MSSEATAARRFLVRGDVQGVGFRAFVAQRARALRLAGFARNLSDGRVEVLAQGSGADLDRLQALLRQGPALSRVDAVERQDAAVDTSRIGFRITEQAGGGRPEERPGVDLSRFIREVPGFPRQGIQFKDITPLLGDGDALRAAVDAMTDPWKGRGVRRVAALESRGFLFGTPIAERLGAGFVPIRKAGKLPAVTVAEEYALEYGVDRIEMHADGVEKGERVLIVDDVLATGGTAAAAVSLLRRAGAEVAGLSLLLELDFLHGRDRLAGLDVTAVLHYPQ